MRRAESPFDVIREALLREWDPIGVAENPNLRDEYDGYVGPVCNILACGSPKNHLEDYLWQAETSQMGLSGDRQQTGRVAERLITLWNGIGAGA